MLYLGIGVFVLICLLSVLLPDVYYKYKKCDRCGKRNNKIHITGYYGSSWYECKCKKDLNNH